MKKIMVLLVLIFAAQARAVDFQVKNNDGEWSSNNLAWVKLDITTKADGLRIVMSDLTLKYPLDYTKCHTYGGETLKDFQVKVSASCPAENVIDVKFTQGISSTALDPSSFKEYVYFNVSIPYVPSNTPSNQTPSSSESPAKKQFKPIRDPASLKAN